MAILPDEKDLRIVWVLAIIDRKNHHGAVVAHDVTPHPDASGLQDFIARDPEDLALVNGL